MNVQFHLRALVVLAALLVDPGAAVHAREVHCQRGDLLRRVELRQPPSGPVACEVVYWKDTEAPGVERVLWRAQRDRDFCETKARALVERLSGAGWSCAAATPSAAAVAPREPASSRSPSPGPAPTSAPLPVSKPRSSEAAGPGTAAASTPAADSPPAAAAAPRRFHADQLNATVTRTLASIRELYGADPQADDAHYGDLDGDGRDDAAVLITYQAVDEGPIQFVVVYRFDGTAYRSAATKKVSGRFMPAVEATIAGIADGTIEVDLQEADGGACCRTRRAAFALRDESLIEVEPSSPSNATAQR